MTFKKLQEKIQTPVFSHTDVLKLFPDEPVNHLNTQLSRMTARGDLVDIKRGLYAVRGKDFDEFLLANKLYSPSYVSLETALNSYGVIPDVTALVTSVTTVTSKSMTTPFGSYTYSKLKPSLFFGFANVLDGRSGEYYQIAEPEKALLDWIYIRKIKSLKEYNEDYRVTLSEIDRKKLLSYSSHFPGWVEKVLKE